MILRIELCEKQIYIFLRDYLGPEAERYSNEKNCVSDSPNWLVVTTNLYENYYTMHILEDKERPTTVTASCGCKSQFEQHELRKLPIFPFC